MSARVRRLSAAAVVLSIVGLLAWWLIRPAEDPRAATPPGGSARPTAPETEPLAPEAATVAPTTTAPPEPSATPSTFAIEGSVTLDGEPLRDVPVRLVSIDPPGAEVRVRTDAAGRFDPSLASGEWEVLVEHGRGPRVTSDRPRAVVQVGTAQVFVIGIEREDGTIEARPPRVKVDLFTAGDLTGQVVDARTGRGVGGAIVSVDGRASTFSQATADAQGRFELPLPGPALRRTRGVSPHVLARAPGYAAGGVELRRLVASQGGPDAALAPLRIALEPGLTLHGVVTDLQGAPVRARVRARATSRDALVEVNWSLETAPDGTFVLENVPTGTRSGPMFERDLPGRTLGPAHASVAIAVEAEGYEVERVPAAAAGPGAEPTHVRLRTVAEVDGSVLGPDGAPLAGALVAFSRDLAQLVGELGALRVRRWFEPHPPMGLTRGRTPPDGRFRFSCFEGPAWLLVLAPGRVPHLVALSPPVTGAVVRPDAAGGSIAGSLEPVPGPFDERGALHVFACVPGADAPSAPALTLARGEVRAIDLASLPGAVVAEAALGDDGAFQLDGLPTGAYELRVWARGERLPLADRGFVRPGEAAALSVRPSGLLVIRAQASTSSRTFSWVVVPESGARVSGQGDLGRPGEEVVVATGDVLVAAFAKGHAPAVTRVTVGGRELEEARLTLSPGGADVALELTYPARPVEALELRWRDAAIDVERVMHLPAVPTCTLEGVGDGRFDLRVTVHERIGDAVRPREIVVPISTAAAAPQVVDLR